MSGVYKEEWMLWMWVGMLEVSTFHMAYHHPFCDSFSSGSSSEYDSPSEDEDEEGVQSDGDVTSMASSSTTHMSENSETSRK